MKKTVLIKSFLFALVLSGVVAVSANAMMNEFKIADLNLDGQPEIVLADSRNLYVLDKDGNILTSKSFSEIYNSDNGSGTNTTTTIYGMGGGMMGRGNGGNGGGGMMGGRNGGNWGGGMMGGGIMGGGSIQIEIANMDETPNPEIVVRYSNKLLVLDENLELKNTITLPVKTSYPF
jgi:hypothetical protein